MTFMFTISDVLYFAFIIALALLGLWLYVPIWWRQWNCKHDGNVNETRACEAICRQCGKNLGFIGAWRERRAAAPAQGQQGE